MTEKELITKIAHICLPKNGKMCPDKNQAFNEIEKLIFEFLEFKVGEDLL